MRLFVDNSGSPFPRRNAVQFPLLCYYILNVYVPPQINMLKSQLPKMMVLGSGDFGRYFIKECPERYLALPPCEDTEIASYRLGQGPSPETVTLLTL